jgi:hypothetical protein
MELERAAGALERRLAGQLAAALARPEEAATRRALAAAGEVWRQIAPRDALEQLLAVQMIAGHEAALDGYARARAAGALAEAQGEAAPEALADSERARRAELRLAARLSSLFARQAALLARRREAADRRAGKARKEAAARAQRQAEAAALPARSRSSASAKAGEGPGQSGVVIEPLEDDLVAMARRWATEVKANERRLRAGLPPEKPQDDAPRNAAARTPAGPEGARPHDRAPDPPPGPDAAPDAVPGSEPRPARRPAQGRQTGVLVVPEKPSPEDWTRSLREYYRVLEAPP